MNELPEVGIDIGGFITAATVGLGALLLVILSAWFAYRVLRVAARWVLVIGASAVGHRYAGKAGGVVAGNLAHRATGPKRNSPWA